jgi:hypothetical protein
MGRIGGVTPEGKVKAAVKSELDRFLHYREMPVPGGFGKSGLDFTICFYGYFVAIETKKPGGEPTARQWERIDEITAAGGIAVVVTSAEQAKTELRELLTRLHEHACSESQREAQDDRRAALSRSFKPFPRRKATLIK